MSHQSDWLRGLGSVESMSEDPGYITQLVSDVRQFADVLQNLKEAFGSKDEGVSGVVSERLAELLRVLKSVIGKHQALNSEDILSAAGTLIAKVKVVPYLGGGVQENSSIVVDLQDVLRKKKRKKRKRSAFHCRATDPH